MTTTEPETVFTLDIPQREGKEGYIGTIFGLYLRLGGIIADSNFKETDIRLYYMTKVLINLIPGKDNRAKINDKLKKDIEEAMKGVQDSGERIKIRNDICIDYIGEVHDFVDKHIGVSKENKIGFCVKPK